MKTTTSEINGYSVIHVIGRLNSLTAPDFEEFALESVDGQPVHLVLDFKEMDYISSAGLRSILVIGKKVKSQNGNLYLCGIKGVVLEVIQLSGFDAFFKIAGSPEELPNIS